MKVKVSLKLMTAGDFEQLKETSMKDGMTLYPALKYPRRYKGDFIQCEECLIWYSVWLDKNIWGTIWFEKENAFDDIASVGMWLSTKEERFKNADIAAIRMAVTEAAAVLNTAVTYLNVRSDLTHVINNLIESGFVDVGEGVDMTDTGERFHYKILMFSVEE